MLTPELKQLLKILNNINHKHDITANSGMMLQLKELSSTISAQIAIASDVDYNETMKFIASTYHYGGQTHQFEMKADKFLKSVGVVRPDGKKLD